MQIKKYMCNLRAELFEIRREIDEAKDLLNLQNLN